jgi:hypothetical protein
VEKKGTVMSIISEKSKTQRVFISYRHTKPDEDLALALEAVLTREGCQVFVDRRMLVGTEWAAEIDCQLKTAQFFVVLLSAESIRSDMVRQEIKLAHELKQQQKLRILPVRVDFTGALPYDLGGYLNPLQYALWQKGQSADELTETLRLAIRDAGELPHFGRSEGEGDSLAEIQAGGLGRLGTVQSGDRARHRSRAVDRRYQSIAVQRWPFYTPAGF